MRTVIALSSLILTVSAAISFDDLTPYIESYIANHTFPGAQVAVVLRNGTLKYQRNFENLTYEGDPYSHPVTNETLYDIASLSKVVSTTSCIMRLYEQGAIALDDAWVKYVPEASNNGKDKITLRNLLLHNSGLAADYPFGHSYNGVTM
jgi:CubicO group peptidase (beta-lactamase class C family)